MSSGLKLYYRTLLLALMGLFLWGYNPSPAQAACASPSGVAGELLYDDGDSVMTYCDGTNWIEFPKVAGGGGPLNATSVTGQCAVLNDGTAWCWGDNDKGQLGNNTTTFQPNPVRVGTSGTGTLWNDWTKISSFSTSTCGLRNDGTAWCWGYNAYGQLGNNDAGTNQSIPVQVGTSGTGTLWSDWTAISAGSGLTCGLRSNGTAWCWGSNLSGELGNNDPGNNQAIPVQVGTSGTGTLWSDWTAISAAGAHACGLRTNGTIWCWGNNYRGELGNNNEGVDSPIPVQAGSYSDYTAVSAGGGSSEAGSCGIRSDGTLWCWGGFVYIGIDDTQNNNKPSPTQVGTSQTGTLFSDWTLVSHGGEGVCGLRNNGTIWCWGRYVDDYTLARVPVQKGKSDTLFTDWLVFDRSCGIRSDGSTWCWGDNTGSGAVKGSSHEPVEVGIEDTFYIIKADNGRAKDWTSPATLSWNGGFTGTGKTIICVATLGTVTSVETSTGGAFTLDASNTGSGVNTYIYSRFTSWSSNMTVNINISGTVTWAAIAVQLEGLLSSPLDQTASASGSSSTPSSGLTGTTAQDDEVVFGCLGTNGPDDDDYGAWTSLNAIHTYSVSGTTGQGATSNVTVAAGWRRVNSTGTYEAAKTGIQSRTWAAAVATYKTVSPAAEGLSGPGTSGGGGSGCSSPTGVAGMMLYDTGDDVMTYCNGSSWVEAGPNPGNGGAGCSSPSGTAGSMIYDNGDSVLTYCDGANWVKIGK